MAHNVIAEAKRCLNCKKPLCRTGCPINTPIPDFIQTFLKGDIDGAGKMLFDNNPLSVVCSIVCNHGNQCQGHCVRGLKGEPVGISTIENFISERYLDSLELKREPSNGIKVAVVGSGPAGITISIKMAQLGYDVTVFESKSDIGGVLRFGIPEFRLPKSIVDRYKTLMLHLGIKLKFNVTIGKAFGVEELFRDGFKAISIGTGVTWPIALNIKGETLGHVHYGVHFLEKPEAYRDQLGKSMIIIGAGNDYGAHGQLQREQRGKRIRRVRGRGICVQQAARRNNRRGRNVCGYRLRRKPQDSFNGGYSRPYEGGQRYDLHFAAPF